MDMVVLCVACLTVFVNCLVKPFARCLGVVVILLLNVMEVFSVSGGALLDGPCVGAVYGGRVWGPCMGAVYGGRVWGPCMGAVYGGRVWGPCMGAVYGGRVWGPCMGAVYGGRVLGPCMGARVISFWSSILWTRLCLLGKDL